MYVGEGTQNVSNAYSLRLSYFIKFLNLSIKFTLNKKYRTSPKHSCNTTKKAKDSCREKTFHLLIVIIKDIKVHKPTSNYSQIFLP